MTLTARPRLLIRFAVLAALALCGIVLALSSTGTPPVGAQDGSVPAKPTGVVATATHDSVALAWDDPGDASITHYQIFRRDRDVHDAGEFVTIKDDTGSAATSYTDDTVEPETRYVYRVKAVNAHGASHWSDYRRADTPAAPDPADLAPSGLEVSLVENRVTLTWDAPASDAASVTGYEILRRRPNESEAALTTLVADTGNAETSYTDDAANEPGVRYTYRVKALRDGEQSQVSNFARIDLPEDYAQDTSGSDEPTPTPEPTPEPDKNTPATGAPTISGTVQVGETLTAETSVIDDTDGLGNPGYGYQWVRYDETTDSDITGANSSTYTPVDADVGKTIKVRVSFTDDRDFEESLTSEATESVAAAATSADDGAIWSATMTVGIANGNSGFSAYTDLGELTPTGFTLNGTEYLVKILGESDGQFYFALNPDVQNDFRLHVGEAQFASEDASIQTKVVRGSVVATYTSGIRGR